MIRQILSPATSYRSYYDSLFEINDLTQTRNLVYIFVLHHSAENIRIAISLRT